MCSSSSNDRRARSSLPSAADRQKKKDFFQNAEPIVGEKPSDEELAALESRRDIAAVAIKNALDEDAPRRERVLQMKGCLDGMCCYKTPGNLSYSA
mmetsp:Transcript_11376/g.24313  ORF Transcript_11376/g.24313 Transcript_11376/m.24313 type:complete len:96 (+) Transcript_11376:236-523(+)|eukprot:6208850-Pleurochrysis_carterae.AAC.3